MEKDSKWEFESPKCWDLSEIITQDRPNESWFTERNISAPSFGAPKKRRALRVLNFDNKHVKTSHQSKDENVFDRLARESTISFSRKIVTQGKQHELNIEPATESVAESISRLEKPHPTELLYAEMKRLEPNPLLKRSIIPHSFIQKPSQKDQHIKQNVTKFFDNLMKEHAPMKELQEKKRSYVINTFFNDLLTRNKFMYEKKKDKQPVKQQIILVTPFEKKRSKSSTITNQIYKRARTELPRFK